MSAAVLTPLPVGDTNGGIPEGDRRATMNPEEWKRMLAIVEAALHRDPEERDNFVDAACAGHASLRAVVTSMLRACTESADGLAATAYEPTRFASDSSDGSSAASQNMLRPGQVFGPRYHIIRILGVGGMGAVYHAWDAELGVAVALKVIRPDMTANPETA